MANYVITASQVLWLGGTPIQRGTAGATIAAGEGVALNATTGKLVKSDALVMSTQPFMGIALSSADANQPIHYATAGASVRLTTGADLDVNAMPVFASVTAGKLMPHTDLTDAADGYPQLVGFLYNAANRRNIKLSFAVADGIYAD